jgi:hypothetical protein
MMRTTHQIPSHQQHKPNNNASAHSISNNLRHQLLPPTKAPTNHTQLLPASACHELELFASSALDGSRRYIDLFFVFGGRGGSGGGAGGWWSKVFFGSYHFVVFVLLLLVDELLGLRRS